MSLVLILLVRHSVAGGAAVVLGGDSGDGVFAVVGTLLLISCCDGDVAVCLQQLLSWFCCYTPVGFAHLGLLLVLVL